MTVSEFIGKFKSRYLWGNLVAMVAVVVLLAFGFKAAVGIYTHHGESIAVPKLIHKNSSDAEHILNELGLKMEVTDTGYVKTLPPGCILEQSPAHGERVKSGHVINVIINATSSPTITLPDVIDNCSLREAMAKLTAMGFKLGKPEFIAGEKDWVYGILVKGRHVASGDKIPVDDVLIIQVGNGMRSANDSVNYVDPVYQQEDAGDIDDFEEVTSSSEDEVKTKSETPPSAQ